jgi:hypothetical protein
VSVRTTVTATMIIAEMAAATKQGCGRKAHA